MIYILALAVVAGFIGYFSPLIWRVVRTKALQKQVTQNRILVLTYDDGPSSGVTPKLLDLLKTENVKASFFMLGRSAEQFPEIASRIVREGHDVGCHSDQHLNAWKTTPWRAISDIKTGYDKLSAWIDSAGMFRPPYGKITLPTFLTVRRRGAQIWWWTIVSGDTENVLPKPQKVVDALISQGGGVILMHDLDRDKDRNEFVLETTSLLIDAARQQSFNIKKLSELSEN